ncbi:hypothetical protein PIB30_038247 [Stylosanthes scabra]|uniref:Uncharacterized protein n=1 Tax=Stylosanthes scabra TaxID=79078 RepID=A0ABU6VBV3_9FABA|nr:hypothetical protein [Stylosanthes scabra]
MLTDFYFDLTLLSEFVRDGVLRSIASRCRGVRSLSLCRIWPTILEVIQLMVPCEGLGLGAARCQTPTESRGTERELLPKDDLAHIMEAAHPGRWKCSHAKAVCQVLYDDVDRGIFALRQEEQLGPY